MWNIKFDLKMDGIGGGSQTQDVTHGCGQKRGGDHLFAGPWAAWWEVGGWLPELQQTPWALISMQHR